jgi:hypothetical protein
MGGITTTIQSLRKSARSREEPPPLENGARLTGQR